MLGLLSAFRPGEAHVVRFRDRFLRETFHDVSRQQARRPIPATYEYVKEMMQDVAFDTTKKIERP